MGSRRGLEHGGPQAVTAPLSRAAIFLVATVRRDAASQSAVRELTGQLPALLRTVGFRDGEAGLSCVLGFGCQAWDRLFDAPRPAELHPFTALHGVHDAPATPGDVFFHIRASRMDLCFELAALLTAQLGQAVEVVDEVHGFRYFDYRDLLGFVDGTENPTGVEADAAVLVGPEDAAYAGGSYVLVQKYLHDLTAWDALPIEEQERVIGRRKLSDVELDDETKPSYAHNELTNIVVDGTEIKILRDNMPFGTVGRGEFGTYFIGYASSPQPIEQMLVNMFLGDPPGNYDRILDFSTAVTGGLFFVPPPAVLETLADGQQPPADADADSDDASEPARPGSLNIGSLKGQP